ncbi:MAG: hypothetical protein ACN4E6_18020 [Qipengyuania pacifica]|jgi:hypothetical protein|tara:strand:+ start:38128 stop:38745 length:618 start_codon:yes stop_codon:yes gene_type:complete
MESAERELDFVIVKNIGDLETSVRRAEEEIDVRLNGEAWATLKQSLGTDAWYFEDAEEPSDAWFAPRDWLETDENGDLDADPWFRLKPLDVKRGYHTWLAHYAAPKTDREQMAIVWCWHRFYVDQYKAAATKADRDLQTIRDIGFHQDGRELFYPITFDVDALAEGFRHGDLKAALEPITRAAELLKQAVEPFAKFRAKLRKQPR